MKFSESWLRAFVDPEQESEALSHALTMAGLEVEAQTAVAPPFDSVVVARILHLEKHPDADRLNVCQVDTGEASPRQIVCGAPNAAVGLRVPCALPGAVLPGDFAIQAARVRGVESAGMLCSARELGISEDASGLLVLPDDTPPGQPIRTALDLDDRLFTLKLTPNRADCLSLFGIAREVAAITGAPATFPEIPAIPASIDPAREIVLEAPEACPLYCGRLISGVDARAPTPDWMKRRLERSGLRSISALVDITNYVMLELGQPLHAFDDTRLEGAIHVRRARPGETLRLLNEQTVALAPDVLMIADDAQPLAMAGIMGGEASGITLETRELFLESAFFAPGAIAGRARRYGFASDASHRFERGVDFGGTRRALERATRLVLDLCGGQAGPIVEAAAPLPERKPLRLRTARVGKVLGIALPVAEIARLLQRLALPFAQAGEDFLITPPSYRFDLEVEEDLIEEVARLHGYDAIPAPAPRAALAMRPQTETARPLTALRQMLAGRGYQEVVNYAFVDTAWEADFAGNSAPILLANPIASQMAAMRSSLIGGLVANLVTNLKRKQSRVRLFETGRAFLRQAPQIKTNGLEGFGQPLRLAGLAYGGALPEGWGRDGRALDFHDLKGDLEALLLPAVASFEPAPHPALHPGRSARLSLDGRILGILGELHPQWVQKYELPLPPLLFELELDVLTQAAVPAYREVSRFPPVIRDLAVLVDRELEWQTLLESVRTHASSLVHTLHLFDVYTGKGIPENKKSLAFRIVMQDTRRTLQDAEADAATQQLIAHLERTFDARLRA